MMKRYLLASMILMMSAFSLSAQTKVVAHRGYWDTENSAQNSLSSLINASEIGAYGSEFDVHVTKDGIAVIFHDDEIHGKRIDMSDYSEISDYRLSNGEKLPLLKDYIEEGRKHPGLKLIVEIKEGHSEDAEIKATREIVRIINELGAKEQVEYISFSLVVVKELIRLELNAHVSYLNGDLTPAEAKKIGCSGIDYEITVFLDNKEWIREALDLGLTVNSWTVNKKVHMFWLAAEGADYITTDDPLLLQQVIASLSEE